jgi:catechol 2,3-dioxygenase-like lactoylglutathione lyase family enzyme
VIDHFGINCADYARSQQFYDRVLGVLGYSRQLDFGEAIGYGRDGKQTHFAFAAADHDAVRAFRDAAVGLGAESLHSPRLWPEYHEGYFAAFVRDPDGNNVEAVCHG